MKKQIQIRPTCDKVKDGQLNFCKSTDSLKPVLDQRRCSENAAGMAVRTEENASGDASSEPAGADEGDARTGPRETAHGEAGKDGHRRHQEDGEGGTNGEPRRV